MPTLWQAAAASMPASLLPALLLAAVGVLGAIPPVERWNERVSIFLQGPDEQPLTVLGDITGWLFSGQLLLPAALVLCLVLLLRGRVLLAFSAGVIFPLIAVEAILKLLIDRPPASAYLRVRVLTISPGTGIRALEHGFPSGHAARIAFAIGWLALLLTPRRYRWLVLSGMLLLTLFVCWTRIYVGDHSLLEIVAGLLLATAFLPLAAALMALARG